MKIPILGSIIIESCYPVHAKPFRGDEAEIIWLKGKTVLGPSWQGASNDMKAWIKYKDKFYYCVAYQVTEYTNFSCDNSER